MKYSEVSHGLLVALCVISIIYVIYAIWHDYEADMAETDMRYKMFADEIRAKMETIPELDAAEKAKISEGIADVVEKKKQAPRVIKSCVLNAARGCLTGAVTGGGIDGALTGGAVFGLMSPLMMGIENMLG